MRIPIRSGIPRFDTAYGVQILECVLQYELLAELNSKLSEGAVEKVPDETPEQRKDAIALAQEEHRQKIKEKASDLLNITVWETVDQAWQSRMVSLQLIWGKNTFLILPVSVPR